MTRNLEAYNKEALDLVDNLNSEDGGREIVIRREKKVSSKTPDVSELKPKKDTTKDTRLTNFTSAENPYFSYRG